MTVPVAEDTVGIWMVQTGFNNTVVITLTRKEAGGYDITAYLNSTLLETKQLHERPLAEILDQIRDKVAAIMTKAKTDRGWEAIRGHRTMDEYMTVLRRLPGFKEKPDASVGQSAVTRL